MNFEQQYLSQLDRRWSYMLLAHIPLSALIAWWFETSPSMAAGIAALVASLPVALAWLRPHSAWTALLMAMATMGMSAIMIAFSGGVIEFHFHIFMMLALLIVYGRWWVLVAAAATIAVHHVAFWMFLPTAVFNYEAPFSMVLVHAAFVVVQVVPSCFIADRFNRFVKAQGRVVVDLEHVTDDFARRASVLRQQNDDHQTAHAQITDNASSLASGFASVAASSDQVGNIMGDVAHQMQDASDGSNQVSDLVNKIREAVADVQQSAQTGADQAVQVAEQAQKAGKAANSLAESSKEIDAMLAAIRQIAERIDLLSLNATIEAASAGEAGRSFAVVASEIKDLANQSGKVVAGIEAQMSAIRDDAQGVETAVSQADASIMVQRDASKAMAQRIADQLEAVNSVGLRTDSVAQSVQASSEAVNEVHAALADVSARTEELSRTADAISETMQQLSKEGLASSQSLGQMQQNSQSLQQLSGEIAALVA